MAEATPADVREEVDSSLSDLDISDILDRAARDIDREYDADAFSTREARVDFEAVLAALRIATGRERRARTASSESTSVEFRAIEIDALRVRLVRRDPGEAFGRSVVATDSDRNYGEGGYGT